MAGESITFDFIGRGAGTLQQDFKKVGDNAALAARGARLCADAIDRERKAADASVGATLALARADKLLADAEQELARDALEADVALRREGNAAKKAGADAAGARDGFRGLAGELTGFGAAADAATSGGNKFKLALAGLNLASGVAEPLAAGLVVAAGGLAAAYASAGIGLGVFGAVAQTVFTQASQAATKYAAAVQKYDAATTSKQRAAALQQEKLAFAGLAPPVKTLAIEIGNVKQEWQGFTNAAAPGVVGVITKAFGLLPRVFALMKPFLAPVESALTGIIGELRGGIAPGSTFSKIMRDFAAASGQNLKLGLETAGHLLLGLLGVVHAFLPYGTSLLTWVEQASVKFQQWGTTLSGHTGFQSLMQTFRTETPQAVAVLKNLGVVVANITRAMFGLSTFSNSKLLLQALQPLSGILASLSRNTALDRIVLYLYAAATAASKLAPAFGGVKAAVAFFPSAWKSIVAFSGAVEGATAKEVIAAAATKVWAGAQAVLNAVMDANPIVLIATAAAALGVAFYVAWQKSAGFRDVIKTIASAALSAGIVIVKSAKFIVDAWLNMVGTIIHGAARAFGWVPGIGGLLKGAARQFDGFRAGVDGAFGSMIKTMQGWQGELGASKRATDSASKAIISDMTRAGYSTASAKGAVQAYTTAIQRNGAQSNQARSARQALIRDLEASGISARDANRLVDNLETSINRMHGKTVNVGVHGSGSGGAKITVSSVGGGAFAGKLVAISNRAAGGMITGGTAGRDSVPIMAMPGEVVVPTGMVRAGAVDHLRGRLPGFAAGGLVSPSPDVFAGNAESSYGVAGRSAFGAVAAAAYKAVIGSVTSAVKAAAASVAGGVPGYKPGAGVQQWRGVVQQALRLAGSNVAQLTDPVLYQMQTESGGNPTIVNKWDSNWFAGHPSVGLMQVIRGTFQAFAGQFRNTGPFEYGVSVNPLANVYSAIKYAQFNYGPGLRNAYGGIGTGHGYDRGGWLMPGWTAAYNGTGRPEMVVPASRGGAPAIQLEVTGTGSGTFDAFLLKWIRENVRVKGGGDVQAAFGRR